MIDNIPGYPGYHITKKGKLYSRWVPRKTILSDEWKLRRPQLTRQGRLQIKLRFDIGKQKFERVHRLVALAYIPNPKNKPLVCHKDNNPLNNHYKNLYWGTQSINMKQAYNDGRIGKLNSDQVLEILSSNLKEEELAKKYNVSIKVIHRCLKRKKKNR